MSVGAATPEPRASSSGQSTGAPGAVGPPLAGCVASAGPPPAPSPNCPSVKCGRRPGVPAALACSPSLPGCVLIGTVCSVVAPPMLGPTSGGRFEDEIIKNNPGL